MAKPRIITDVTALLGPAHVAQHRIAVLPMHISFGDETFVVGPGDDARRLWQRLAAGPAQPSRITIPAEAFEEAYTRLSRDTEEILVLLSSGVLSNGVSQAQASSRAFMGRSRIMVVDSLTTSWGLGLAVYAAAQVAARGQSLDAIVRLIRGMLPHIYVLLSVDRLDYLEQSGRIGAAQALLGTMLRIKPMLLVEDGDVIPLEKVRSAPMAIEKLVAFVSEFASIDQVVIARSPLHDPKDERIGQLTAQLREVLPKHRFPVLEYDPVLACHVGPDALGVMVYEGS